MKKELIEKIMSMTHPTQDLAYIGKGFLQQILEENLPDFQRIDWERLRDCFEKASNGYVSSHLHVAVKEYNSTLTTALKPLPKDMPKEFSWEFNWENQNEEEVWEWLHTYYGTPANNLQPLPKEMPKWFHNGISYHDLWSMVCLNYGTPEPKPDLPTVEELAKEVYDRFRSVPSGDDYTVFIAQHLHDKYSLHPREWWKDAIPYSTQFKYNDTVYTFSEYSYESSTQKTWIHNTGGGKILCSHCTPYTPPTAQEIIAKHNLSDEEVRVIREGKCT